MPDRLSELVRQRALVSEHLAWLDREIAHARGADATPMPAEATRQPVSVPTPSPLQKTEPMPAPTPLTAATANSASDVPAETEILLDQYRITPAAVKQDVRKGCLLYFVGAFVVLGIVIAVLYFALGAH